GVKEIREAVVKAQQYRAHGRKTVLFIDEVHRFNKSQQDAFLPYVEDGTFIFVGATTENPSFELNNALLSRARVLVLKRLEAEQLLQLLQRALQRLEPVPEVTPEALQLLAVAADGDGRRVLNMLELGLQLANHAPPAVPIVKELLGNHARRVHHDDKVFDGRMSALHKSVRGSDADGAMSWLVRMLDGGCDPQYEEGRVVLMAREDIDNADR